MLKISLYQFFCVSLCKHIKTQRYRKNQSYTTDRPTTSAIRGRLSPRQEPRIPHALSRSASEIHRPDFGTGWRTDRHDPYISQFLGETLRGRRNQRTGNTSRTGRKPIMDCSDEESVRKAIENDRQSVKKAKEAWQQASGKEASESTFRAFLSALARDIDV